LAPKKSNQQLLQVTVNKRITERQKKFSHTHLNSLCFLIFRLKGVYIPAQGEALGERFSILPSPVRARHIVTPLQGLIHVTPVSQGVALGWYISARWAARKILMRKP
ncbi:MAG: hypothetical protein JXA11_16170, partial [Phycisphaerae bacterium]|nr:hypothetical protein [Phycisphaerae bacterium]